MFVIPLIHYNLSSLPYHTWSTISIFVLAVVLYLSTQAKGQKEIDGLIGNDRLPEFSDRPSLPYLECVVQALYRWHNALPTGSLKVPMNGLTFGRYTASLNGR